MSAINFSDTTPAALAGGVNVKWQSDASGNVSAYSPPPSNAAIGAMQTPWLQNIDAGGFSLSNVPSVSASAALTLAAGGANTLALQTNAKTRLSIDSAGHVTINAPDSAGAAAPFEVVGMLRATANNPPTTGVGLELTYTGGTGGIGYVQAYDRGGAAYKQLNITGNPLCLNGLAQGNIGIGTTTPANPLTVIQSANPTTAGSANQIKVNEVTNNPAYGLGIGLFNNSGTYVGVVQATSGSPTNGILALQPTGGNVGVGTTAPAYPLDVTGAAHVSGGIWSDANIGLNIYFNGANWIYRNAGCGSLWSYDANGSYLWATPAGTAGATASPYQVLKMPAAAALAIFATALIVPLSAPGNAAVENQIPNTGIVFALTSNTQLTFRVRGSDGVMRSGNVTLA